jgi:hypothetical protein
VNVLKKHKVIIGSSKLSSLPRNQSTSRDRAISVRNIVRNMDIVPIPLLSAGTLLRETRTKTMKTKNLDTRIKLGIVGTFRVNLRKI